jgi:hypothetical protein
MYGFSVMIMNYIAILTANAIFMYSNDAAALQVSSDVLAVLINHGADGMALLLRSLYSNVFTVNARDSSGQTSLMVGFVRWSCFEFCARVELIYGR